MPRQDAIPNGITPPPVKTSRLPRALRFPLLAIISLSLSIFSYSAAYELLGYRLGSVSRTLNDSWGPVAFLSARVAELYVGWHMRYDDLDTFSLSLLTQAPSLYLLHTFYLVPLPTLLVRLGVDSLSVVLPTKLLRPRSALHNRRAPKTAVPNRDIIHSPTAVFTTAFLGATAYAFTLYAALQSGLTTFLVSHFTVATLEPAHAATLQLLIATMLPVGWAAQSFLFTPSFGAQPSAGDAADAAFNPATATLAQTVRHNVWGWSKRTKVLVQQTAVLAALTGSHTTRMAWANEGTDLVGAAGYAGVWVLAGLLAGGLFGWVGDVGETKAVKVEEVEEI
ncbi:uncharacterized protein BDZ99DRAFT_501954 [Mytilinidion resinicola]|uniref:Uncharacterized protein n=1 Tax=Mytilinidion resinicola TaxID=574789 RepID=A0A6A6Y8V8_9PEZI|nr:uncharacterized protein BDZ99DRAFT_501954 [Mytilinidion resinicola]KAF2805069.1 hypothetical protein BDZ99DRAFT_501954 [Mytilinidion resinicola]